MNISRVEVEIRVDEVLADRVAVRLKADAPQCPESVWQDIQSKMDTSTAKPKPARTHKIYSLVSLAACVVIALGWFYWPNSSSTVQALEIVVDLPQDVALTMVVRIARRRA